jgi:hypothetical protein
VIHLLKKPREVSNEEMLSALNAYSNNIDQDQKNKDVQQAQVVADKNDEFINRR